MKISLAPLDSAVAKELASRRVMSVDELVARLLREEASLELIGARKSQPEFRPAVEVVNERAE